MAHNHPLLVRDLDTSGIYSLLLGPVLPFPISYLDTGGKVWLSWYLSSIFDQHKLH